MTIDDLRIQEPLFESWLVDSKIGEGADFSLFRLRRETQTGIQYAALKAVDLPASKNQIADALSSGKFTGVKAFLDAYIYQAKTEAELLIQLSNNKNILAVYNYTIIYHEQEPRATLLLLMEYAQPLSERLNGDAITEKAVVQMGCDICNALSAFEQMGIYHGDIKPDNIFVDLNGNYKLGDFGFGKDFFWQKELSSAYLAPELFYGQTPSIQSDLYSLGILMYQFLNHNRTPFLPSFPQAISLSDRESALEKLHRGEAFPAPDMAGKSLATVLLKACQAQPSMRHSSAELLRSDLSYCIFGAPIAPSDMQSYASTANAYGNVSAQNNAFANQETTIIPEYIQSMAQMPAYHPIRPSTPSAPYRTVLQQDDPEIPEENEEALPPEPPKKKINGVFLAILVLVILVIAIAGIFIFKNKKPANEETTKEQTTIEQTTAEPEETTVEMILVDNFVNASYKIIEGNTAYTQKLTITPEYVFDDATEGTVIKQSIPANSRVEKGTAIKLTVSKGPEKIVAENVVGLSYEEAEKKLKDIGFSVTRVTIENPSTYTQGTVAEMSVKANEKYDKGTVVTLRVWGEPITPTTTTLPPTETTTQPPTEPSTQAQAIEVPNPDCTYDIQSGIITVEPNCNIGSNPHAMQTAQLEEYRNGNLSLVADVDFECFADFDGSNLVCTIDLSAEDFIDTSSCTYIISFPEGAIKSDTGSTGAFSVNVY